MLKGKAYDLPIILLEYRIDISTTIKQLTMKVRIQIIICILVLLTSMLYTKSTNAQCSSNISASDSVALLDLYAALDGPNWNNNFGWASATVPVEDWYGVEVNDVAGVCRVTSLYLNSNNLSGILDANINLTALDSLDFSWNNLSGSIPDFTSLPSLVTLKLKYNQFSGNLPDFSNLPALDHFELRSNQVSGSIPDFSNLPVISWINMPDNNLSGSIPDFSSIPTLELLGLDENPLTGSIPDFSNLPNLEYFAIEYTDIGGVIPDFTGLSSLVGLFIHDCQLIGTVPDFTNLPNLESLILHNNNLDGILPDFTNLPSLVDLEVCDNNFWGPIPTLSASPLIDPADVDFTCIYCVAIAGVIYEDVNENCIYDIGEPTLPGVEVTLNSGELTVLSDESGQYQLLGQLGINEVTIGLPNSSWSNNCSSSSIVNAVNCSDPVSSLDFGFSEALQCPNPSLKVSSSGLVPCEQSTYQVDYCNDGTESLENASIRISLEPELTMLGSDIPFTIVDSKYEFQIGTIPTGECGDFSFTTLLDCSAPLGSTGCVEAEIFPLSSCAYSPGPGWDGSDLELNAQCISDSIIFTIKNLGDDMSDTSTYKIYSEDVLIGAFPFDLASGEELEYIHQNTNAAALRIEVEQRPGHPSLDNPRKVVELCGQMPFSLGFVTSTPLNDLDPHRDLECTVVSSDILINEKTVQPDGIGSDHIIQAGHPLEYKIIFANDLAYSATHVYIVDTIDTEHLNINSLQVQASSHPYEVYIYDESVLVFIFDDISLMDSSAPISLRSGYVIYSFDQNDTNAIGDYINSEAEIIMAYNDKTSSGIAENTIGELLESCNSNGLIQIEDCISAEVNGIEYTMNGNYIQTTINSEGCDSLISVIVDIEYVNVNVSVESNTLQAESSTGIYTWINCDSQEVIAGETGQSFSPEVSGNYALILDNGTCSEMSECQNVTISNVQDYVDDINVYPTTVERYLNIDYGQNAQIEGIELYNAQGQIILRHSGPKEQMEMGDLESSIYYLKIYLKNGGNKLVKIFKK